MITRLYRSKSDIENLSLLKTVIPTNVDRFNYKGYIVNKPWGYEYMPYENPFVSIWVLHFKHQGFTSMHCHPKKKTSLMVLRGEIAFSTLEGFTVCHEGEGMYIDTAVFHSLRANSKKGAVVMEIETPPNKHDLVRLKDPFLRDPAYEGLKQMTRDIHKYEHIDLEPLNGKKCKGIAFDTCRISMCRYRRSLTVHHRIQTEKAHTICLLAGALHDDKGNVLVSTGEMVATRDLQKISPIVVFRDIIYLSIDHHGKSKTL
jgi:mannose-6-phosphate isomerase-like protein (cupin superfamily)